jgi:hypothetical protein
VERTTNSETFDNEETTMSVELKIESPLDPSRLSRKYRMADANHRKASHKLNEAKELFRARKMDDAEFCAIFAEWKKADQEFDAVWQAEYGDQPNTCPCDF